MSSVNVRQRTQLTVAQIRSQQTTSRRLTVFNSSQLAALTTAVVTHPERSPPTGGCDRFRAIIFAETYSYFLVRKKKTCSGEKSESAWLEHAA